MVTANFFIASEIDYSIIKRLYRLNLVKAKFIKVNFFYPRFTVYKALIIITF